MVPIRLWIVYAPPKLAKHCLFMSVTHTDDWKHSCCLIICFTQTRIRHGYCSVARSQAWSVRISFTIGIIIINDTHIIHDMFHLIALYHERRYDVLCFANWIFSSVDGNCVYKFTNLITLFLFHFMLTFDCSICTLLYNVWINNLSTYYWIKFCKMKFSIQKSINLQCNIVVLFIFRRCKFARRWKIADNW